MQFDAQFVESPTGVSKYGDTAEIRAPMTCMPRSFSITAEAGTVHRTSSPKASWCQYQRTSESLGRSWLPDCPMLTTRRKLVDVRAPQRCRFESQWNLAGLLSSHPSKAACRPKLFLLKALRGRKKVVEDAHQLPAATETSWLAAARKTS